MNDDRAARLSRIARAERALAQLAAAERVGADAAHAASRADGEAILAALAGDSPLHGLLVTTMAGALRRNAQATENLAARAEAAGVNQRHAEERARIVAERAADAVAAVGRDAERRRLEALGVETAARTFAWRHKPLTRLDP